MNTMQESSNVKSTEDHARSLAASNGAHAESMSASLAADDQEQSVLSTLNDDGSRRWLNPRVSPGRFLTRRRVTAYGLIALFVALPLIPINGHPALLLDIAARRFHIFGTTFYPTDTLLMALLIVGTFVSIFWITALLGRVWCGWACPQTVYMEFVYRPLQRLFEGAPGRPKKGWLQTSVAGKPLKYVAFAIVSFALAHVFLAYFVSWSELSTWVFHFPSNHLLGFGIVMLVTVAMLIDFAFLREQVCIVMCPYGRMQSVMLDKQSLIVKYETKRGEPRGMKKKIASVSLPQLAPAAVGDCVDCHMCVTTCPTGIDIRRGLQMECVGCAQCIDACDSVMDRLKRPRGLIRYSSQAAMEGETPKLLRPRVVIYPTVLVIIATLFVLVLRGTGKADVTIVRGMGQPFVVNANGEVQNMLKVKIVNRAETASTFRVTLVDEPTGRIELENPDILVQPGEMLTVPVRAILPADAFPKPQHPVKILVTGPDGYAKTVTMTMLGPVHKQHTNPAPSQQPQSPTNAEPAGGTP
jgi:cytochrome c oxidase accessory protein FixG